jgi:hypothetical protein
MHRVVAGVGDDHQISEWPSLEHSVARGGIQMQAIDSKLINKRETHFMQVPRTLHRTAQVISALHDRAGYLTVLQDLATAFGELIVRFQPRVVNEVLRFDHCKLQLLLLCVGVQRAVQLFV